MHVEKVKDVASSFGHALPPPRTEVVGKDSVLVSTPQEKESSSVTVHDLSHGLLYVDLKILKDFSMASHSSASALVGLHCESRRQWIFTKLRCGFVSCSGSDRLRMNHDLAGVSWLRRSRLRWLGEGHKFG
ncbi:hypothetical protein YC2023_084469 [Brassica napus]